MSVDEKENEVRRHHLCRNCLRKGHSTKDCSSTITCRKCRGRHHTQLCSHGPSSSGKTPESSNKNFPLQSCSAQPQTSLSATDELKNYASIGQGRSSVLLATAVIHVVDDNGTNHTARALLDSGSECCFMTESFSQRIKAKRTKISIPIVGIGQAATQARCKFISTIRSRITNYTATVEFLVLPKLTVNLPGVCVDVSLWNIPSGIQLADPLFNDSNSVDLVLGAEIFFDLFEVPGKIVLGDSLPKLVNSLLGWVVSGRASTCRPAPRLTANVATTIDLHHLMEKFWMLEEDQNSSCLSVEESACEEHFNRTVTRSLTGRYIVRLPLKDNLIENVTNNRRIALRRLHLLESRLSKNKDLGEQYKNFLDEYLSLGHMCRLSNPEEPLLNCYYLPHHAVIRQDSSTTKLRVVFDASCKTAGGPSLNDALMIGPIVQQDLRSIIMRSRMHRVMLIADIKQMYRQILVDERDTPLQRIVWRCESNNPIDTFELKTVTYGTASAPYLATRTLVQLATDEKESYPMAAKVLINDFYVDDLFSGGSTVADTLQLRHQLESLLAKGGFELRKWASNESEVLDGIPVSHRALQTSLDLDRDQCLKTLGLHWEPASDVLRYNVKIAPPSLSTPFTKRVALSYIAQLFDPLGLVAPVVTTAKLFMQVLWTQRDEKGKPYQWDQVLPTALKDRWLAHHSKLPFLNELRIDRCILLPNTVSIQLHLFSDASEDAYGACVYVRSSDGFGNIKVALLTARSKVAPLKKQSIPRLELCGACIAAELYQKVSTSLRIAADTFFWVDSTIVLSWLNSPPSTWTTFVANRVSKIQLATQNCTWNHTPGQQNPADCISRGTSAELLLTNTLWWHGPDWLQLDNSFWPNQSFKHHDIPTGIPEHRTTPKTTFSIAVKPSFIDEHVEKFSNFTRLLRVTAYCLRFANNCRAQSTQRLKTIIVSVEEINEAETVIIRLVQQQVYSNEWKQLQNSQPIPVKSSIKWFYPIMAQDQLIRIGGRLRQAHLPFDSKHQILLPSTHAFSSLLVRHYHEKHLHAAPQLLLTILRLRYWITGARNLAKRIIHKCIACFRARPRLVEQFMAELPASRITEARPFSVTGVDYWGPITLKPCHRRAAPRKAYVAVFVCFTTKAVHLELVPELTTSKFMQALRRFVSRRGLCADLYSDNGRNFVGAANELRQLVHTAECQQTIAHECASNGIRWHFNPPKASHFGGLWEASIYSAQKHFVRVVGNHTLAYDEMETLLSQIECCLNSRPIVPLSDDPTDFEPLTPGHFLTGAALKAVPDANLLSIPFNRLRQWQQTQQLYQYVWKRWHTEYLSSLQRRSKWINPPVEITTNQLVILKDENTPPMKWITARIVDLHPGQDGVVRVVTVQTSSGRFIRPVAKLCILPITATGEPSPNEPDTSNQATIPSQSS
ncbi:uncharacterized protein LOC128740039 [Sabethes cyaneus]|uniref:uncharacterized protein LOC128740039 n=1 Tax=Sabethes cyaneus TaxID=53552 RepID=UPI00237EBDBD|nr:uncharacterized protein LOC128740039 [Sabethes cyaneus]